MIAVALTKRDEAHVVVRLLSQLLASNELGAVDLALVAADTQVHLSAHAARRALREPPTLAKSQLEAASDLAVRARAGALAVFIGAGVSSGAGVPDWKALVTELGRTSGMSRVELARLESLPRLDQAALIERRFGKQRAKVRRLIARSVSTKRVSLAHHLLAALPVREFVTTNFDTLFERASTSSGRVLSVFPHTRVPDADRWLLKLHGCVTTPDGIIFTREDYLRYEQSHVALAGIMQTLLFTQHVLFVGFSLNDENFHRMADAVRHARSVERTKNAEVFGTALVLEDDPLRRELWEGDLRWVSMANGRRNLEAPALARKLEIFLDELVRASTALADERRSRSGEDEHVRGSRHHDRSRAVG